MLHPWHVETGSGDGPGRMRYEILLSLNKKFKQNSLFCKITTALYVGEEPPLLVKDYLHYIGEQETDERKRIQPTFRLTTEDISYELFLWKNVRDIRSGKSGIWGSLYDDASQRASEQKSWRGNSLARVALFWKPVWETKDAIFFLSLARSPEYKRTISMATRHLQAGTKR